MGTTTIKPTTSVRLGASKGVTVGTNGLSPVRCGVSFRWQHAPDRDRRRHPTLSKGVNNKVISPTASGSERARWTNFRQHGSVTGGKPDILTYFERFYERMN